MNKEIQQEAERILKQAFETTEWYKTSAASFFEEHPTAHKVILQAMQTFAQQKQDERMIEFAKWIIQKHRPCIIPGSDMMFYADNPLSFEYLLTIFKTEKGY